MSSSYAFVVILPNARRANIRLSTNSTVLEVLEQVCKKHELNPAEYDLTHHNKIIDLGNSIRFSGIPNNATLEMVLTSKVRVEGEINLGLQLENGKRLMHSFSPQQTLWDVLEYWEGKGEPILPQGGSNNSTDASVVQPVCIYMRQEVVGSEELAKKTLRSLGLTKGSAMIRLIHRSQTQLRTQASVSAPLSRPSSTLVASLEEEKTLKIPKRAEAPKPHLKPSPQEEEEQEPMDVSPHITTARPLFSAETPGTSTASAVKDQVEMKIEEEASYHFTPPLIQNAQRFSQPGELHLLPGPHDTLLYHGEDVVVSNNESSDDDSFFELTTSDVKRQFVELRDRRKELEETPLQTAAAKELEKDTARLRMLHDYPLTIVRIRFANRFILQGCFRTAEKIQSIYSWLRTHLENENLNFYLFTAPPKNKLDPSSSLIEQDLVGMAIVYFGTEDPDVASDQKVLKPELYSKVSAPDAVAEFVHNKLKKKAEPGGQEGQGQSSNSSKGHDHDADERKPPPPQRAPPTQPKSDGKVPAWFKMK